MADTETWQPGVFRPLLHRVPADARHLYIRDLDVQFSTCNCPTKPAGERVALDETALYCQDCLAGHIERDP